MWRYTLKRLVQGIVTVWFIATATFLAMHNVPGDPLSSDKAMTEDIRKNLEAKYGLDKPLLDQYFIYMGNLALFGTRGMPSHRYPSLLSLIKAGHVDLSPIVAREVGLSDVSAELAAFNGPTPPGVAVVTDFQS